MIPLAGWKWFSSIYFHISFVGHSAFFPKKNIPKGHIS
jgi:hypothetical protein